MKRKSIFEQHLPFRVRPAGRPVYLWEDPRLWKAHFESAVRDPSAWQDEARRLLCAANTLVWAYSTRRGDLETFHYSSMKSTLFLYAVAVENLIKALWIARGGQPLGSGRLAKDLGTHDLCRLMRQAGIATSKGEKDLLALLQGLVESGKYPVSRSVDRQLRLRGFGLGSEVRRILALLDRLDHELVATTQPPLQSNPVIDFTRLGLPRGQSVLRTKRISPGEL